MEFEIIKYEDISRYLKNINPIPFSREFQKFCQLRYNADGVFIGVKSGGELKLILPVGTYTLDDLKIAEVPNAIHYAEPVFVDKNYNCDPTEIAKNLFKFLKVDVIKFNLIDYHKRLMNSNYPSKFVAISLDISSYESADDLLKRGVVLRRRNQIRFSHKQGFTTKFLDPNELEKFYELYKKHHEHRHFVVRGIEELNNFIIAFDEKAKILAAYSGDKIVAGILFLIDGPYLWMIINSSDYAYSYYQVNNYVYWEVIKYAFEKGVKYIDFGGTPVGDSGNIRFKKGLGVKIDDVYSPIFYRNQKIRFNYWFRRKRWHLKLSQRVLVNRFKNLYNKCI